MSWNRALLVLTLVALIAGASLVQQQNALAQGKAKKGPPPGIGPGMPGQPGQPGVPAKKEGYDLGRLTLPKDDDLKLKIDAAEDRIKEKKFKEACESLQKLVGRQEDVFVPRERKDNEGNTMIHYVSVKKEAARLIGSLPKEGRADYQVVYGPRADTDMKQARTNNNYQQMAQVLSLYLHTDAGAEAGNWLATYMLDRGEFQGAARFYQILINRSGLTALKDGQLVRAAFAFHHAGDDKAKEAVLKELERRNPEKLGSDKMTVADLKEAIDRLVASVSAENASDSPIYRSRPTRNAMLPGGTPFLEPAWPKLKMVHSDEAGKQVTNALTALAQRNHPVFGSFSPITATHAKGEKKIPLIVYRDFKGVTAVDLKTGKVAWESPLEWTLDRVLGATGSDKDSSKINAYTQWLGQWLQNTVRPQILFENSVISTLSTDNRLVYAVEDLPVPPPQSMVIANPNWGGPPPQNWGPEVNAAINHNKLVAIRMTGGRLAWELGGTEEKAPLTDTFFLGPPLPLNGKLYVLNEKQQELRLVTINPETGKVLAMQPLASTKDLKLGQDPMRRIQACHLSHGEGILVVPTNAGAIFGVDLLSGSLAWAYPYGEKLPEPPNKPGPGRGGFGGFDNGRQPAPPGFVWINGKLVPTGSNTHWQVTAPAVQDGKVVFTAPDARDIHCVNLRDGTRVWTRSRHDDDLYLAGVFNGKVVIVGKNRTRALSLAKGDVVWELETGLPSGQGAASALAGSTETIYYLPIRQAVNTREPEICAINVDRGLIHAHTRSRKGEVPGNLLFYEGSVLSQSHESVVAYPQLEVKLADINQQLKDNPNDPARLTERGDYLLDKGDLSGAIADFRRAIRNKATGATLAKARTKLYESYTEYFQRDFNKAEEYIKDYEEMCKIDMSEMKGEELTKAQAEERRRRANFLCLVGKGREAQGKLVEAFKHYLELGTEAQKDELIQVVDEPSVRAAPDVWSQGRTAAMIANAKDAKQKAALEEEIKARWNKLKDTKEPVSELRKFVSLFGSLFGVGKEARFTLAERLIEEKEVNAILEAEQHLSLLRADPAPEIAARALETLGRLNERKGNLEDAAFYYRLLGEKYPKVEIDGKKGSEYLEDLATDKRFLPYLDQAGRFTIKGKVTLQDREEKGSFYSSNLAHQFHHYGEPLPFFLGHRLSLDSSHNLRLSDAATNENRWSMRLTYTQFQSIAQGIDQQNGQAFRAKFGFQSQGHLVVLQLGHMVFAVDPLNKGRVLWEKNLSQLPGSNTSAPHPTNAPYKYDPKDGSVRVVYSDLSEQRLGGNSGPLHGGVVCLQQRDAMTAVDPVTGRTLWTRTDVNSRAHVFGDEEHIYVVGMGENGAPTGSRVFRAYDGVSVRVPEFSGVYEKRMQVMGRHILAADQDVKGVLTLRIYDVLEGKDLWKQQFAQGSTLMQSEDPRLAGVVEPSGAIRVVDVVTQKEVLTAEVQDKKHIDKPVSIHLVTDPDHMFVAINGQMDNNKVAGGPVVANFPIGQGLRAIPVNGEVYSFRRENGRLNWHTTVENEFLLLTQFEDLPLLFFTARYQKWVGNMPARNNVQAVTARALAKHNGKLWYLSENVYSQQNFYGLTMDHRTGKVEVAGYNMKVHLTAVPK